MSLSLDFRKKVFALRSTDDSFQFSDKKLANFDFDLLRKKVKEKRIRYFVFIIYKRKVVSSYYGKNI